MRNFVAPELVEVAQEWVWRGVDDGGRAHGKDARIRVIREDVAAVGVVAHVGALLRDRVLDYLAEAGRV
jgi:hypothetical protein